MKILYCFKGKTITQQQKLAPMPAQGGTCNISSGSVSGEGSSRQSIQDLYEEKAHNLRVFSFPELCRATNCFNQLLKIGEGGFGSVYRGFIQPPDGQGRRTLVAVKKLNNDGFQGHKQWMAEVQILGVVEHPNLVKLIGYCSEDEQDIQRLLVYEFMPNKTLEDHLFDRALPALPWNTRLQVALGAAHGLAYLHEELAVQVTFYTSPMFPLRNIVQAFAKLGTSSFLNRVMVPSLAVSLESAGRPSLDQNRPITERKLLDWVKQFPVDSKSFSMIMDLRLHNQYSLAAARRIAKLAEKCLILIRVIDALMQLSSWASTPWTSFFYCIRL